MTPPPENSQRSEEDDACMTYAAGLDACSYRTLQKHPCNPKEKHPTERPAPKANRTCPKTAKPQTAAGPWICSRAGHAPPLSRCSCRTLYGKFRHCRRPPRCRGARPLLDPTHCISPRRPLPRPLPVHTASLGSREGVRDALAAALPSGLPRTLLRTDYLRPNRGLAGSRGRWGVACGGGRGCRRERPR